MSEALRINKSGKLVLPTGSPGIQFGSPDSGGSVNSQTLDDYEEGTFTPAIGGNAAAGSMTAGTAYGIYTKIGRQVSVGIRFENFTLTGASGVVTVSGLPFAGSGSQAYSTSTAPMLYNISFSTDRVQAFYHGTSNTNIYGIQSRNGTTWVSWDVSNFNGSSKYLQFTMVYQTT